MVLVKGGFKVILGQMSHVEVGSLVGSTVEETNRPETESANEKTRRTGRESECDG